MQKAKPYPDEDEKTTIEPDTGWADEPSTAVEQSDAKRAGNGLITHITSTNEHTVDEQHRHPSAPVAPPVHAHARLVITAGNDTGSSQALVAGTSYTIGRGLDNDLVLTDIAVSRKHFDVREDDGTWVIVDRGSGNGTVINGNLEDNPFVLANGDVIEIGTTTFRFDCSTAALPGEAFNGFGSDDDEMSTVAGKTLSVKSLSVKPIDSIDVMLDTPARIPPMRPKTLPPPAIRPRTLGNQGAPQSQGTPGPHLGSTFPMPQMSHRVGPQAPTLLDAGPMLNLASAQHDARPMLAQPAQAMSGNGGGYPQQTGYPQANEIPPYSAHAQMLVAAQLHQRGEPSTAHVQPSAYSTGNVGVGTQPASYLTGSPLTQRAKLALLFGGIVAVALVSSIAVMKARGSAAKPAKPLAVVAPPKLTATPIDPPRAVLANVPKVEPKLAPKLEPKPAPKLEPKPAPKLEPKPEPKPAPKLEPKPEPKLEPKPEPKLEPKVAAKVQQPTQPTQPTQPQLTPVKVERPAPPKQDPATPKADKRVATAEAATDRAESLYKDRKFSDAANLLVATAKSASANDARDLRAKSQKIALFAKVFNTAMAPGSNAKDVFEQLQTATNYDQSLGGFFQADITARLQTIIGKAAVGFFGAGNFERAHQVVAKADAIGAGGDNNIKLVRQNLEAKAQQLYTEAIAAQAANPSEAKDKLKQVKSMTDAKSPTNQKATKALAGS